MQAILTFGPIKQETCQEASRTCMATVIEDVREREKERMSEEQGKYAAHFPYAKENNRIRPSSQNREVPARRKQQ